MVNPTNPGGDIPQPKRIQVDMYRGMEKPLIEMQDGDDIVIKLTPQDDQPVDPRDVIDERIKISLKKIRVDLHNQSYGMISASTGCVSNPGGPGC